MLFRLVGGIENVVQLTYNLSSHRHAILLILGAGSCPSGFTALRNVHKSLEEVAVDYVADGARAAVVVKGSVVFVGQSTCIAEKREKRKKRGKRGEAKIQSATARTRRRGRDGEDETARTRRERDEKKEGREERGARRERDEPGCDTQNLSALSSAENILKLSSGMEMRLPMPPLVVP